MLSKWRLFAAFECTDDDLNVLTEWQYPLNTTPNIVGLCPCCFRLRALCTHVFLLFYEIFTIFFRFPKCLAVIFDWSVMNLLFVAYVGGLREFLFSSFIWTKQNKRKNKKTFPITRIPYLNEMFDSFHFIDMLKMIAFIN